MSLHFLLKRSIIKVQTDPKQTVASAASDFVVRNRTFIIRKMVGFTD